LACSTERSVRAVIALGQQMVADRTLPVSPVHRAANSEVTGSADEMDVAA